jgi:PAS domain-containing protein
MEKSSKTLHQKKISAERMGREPQLQDLFKHMTEGFAYCKMIFRDGKPFDFIYLNVNPAFEKQTGLKDVVGKKVSAVIPGIRKSDPEIFDLYGRVATSGKPETTENYVKSLDMWFSIAVYSPQKGYFVAVFNVLSERKKIEEELKLLARFPAENPNSMMRVSIQNRLIFANKSSAPILKAWNIKQNDLVPNSIQKEIALTVKTQKNNEIEFTCEKKTYSFVLVGVPEHGYINMYGRDISERIQAEENLTRSQQMLKLILDNIPQRVFWKGKDLKHMGCNKKLANDAGLKETSEIVGKDDFQLA